MIFALIYKIRYIFIRHIKGEYILKSCSCIEYPQTSALKSHRCLKFHRYHEGEARSVRKPVTTSDEYIHFVFQYSFVESLCS